MAESNSRPKGGISNWMPKAPGANKMLLEPNAKDNPDSLTPENPFKQTVGGSGKPSGPFGKKGREC